MYNRDLHYQMHQCCQSTIFLQSFIVTRYFPKYTFYIFISTVFDE
ncbi:unnamed protein product [Tenebrio molitor]|nr:unnamed protein product [Tenebrio molitor]